MITLNKIAMVAAIVLPLWNIPLIIRIIKRKSSRDISLLWVVGVWSCIVLMAPSGFMSPDPIWRTYNVINLIFFTLVLITVFIYRKEERS